MIHRLNIEVICHEKGTNVSERFETSFDFKEGINVIHADNTMGKSTCLNAMMYALGLEMLLGRKGTLCLTDALWGKLTFNGKEYEVDKSVVYLTLSNSKDQKITVRRGITDPDTDNRLVQVYEDGKEAALYYVNDPGTAQGEKGFHRFLRDFIDWELPTVNTFDGKDVPLYIECIFPLFFIEQKRGWSKLQANIPTSYGIRNAATQAVEFVLNLDVSKINHERESLKLELSKASTEWDALKNEGDILAHNISGVLLKMPNKTPLKSEEFAPYIGISMKDKIVPLNEWIVYTETETKVIEENIEHAEYSSVEAETELNLLEKEVLEEDQLLEQRRMEYSLEVNSLDLISRRVENIEEDIKKNRETLKVQKYAREIDISLNAKLCPSCGQEMKDTLMPPSIDEEPMSIEDNIEFLKQQQISALFLREQSTNNVKIFSAKIREMEDGISQKRRKIRDMKMELRQDIRIPKISQIRELANKQDSLKRIEDTKEKFESFLVKCKDSISKHEQIYLRHKEISREGFSENDKGKLNSLRDVLRTNLGSFHFTTRPPNEVDISTDSYQPSSDGIELHLNSSASDNIRMIFAYTLALLEVSEKVMGNHLGLMIYDEMRQQDIKTESLRNMYLKMQSLSTKNQFIITSSASNAHFKEITQGINCNLIEFSSKLIGPKLTK